MENNKFIVNVEGCIVSRNKILMIMRGDTESHAPGTLAFPGGQVEAKDSDVETLEDALRREIYEEVGLKIKNNFEYLESKKFVTRNGNKVLDIVMFCEVDSATDFKIDNDEVKECMWMDVDMILSDPRAPQWIKQSVGMARKIIKSLF